MNSLAVPRKAKEAIGAIATLTKPDGTTITTNVEYNLLDALLRDNGWVEGDVIDGESGYSPFPGIPAAIANSALVVSHIDFMQNLPAAWC